MSLRVPIICKDQWGVVTSVATLVGKYEGVDTPVSVSWRDADFEKNYRNSF